MINNECTKCMHLHTSLVDLNDAINMCQDIKFLETVIATISTVSIIIIIVIIILIIIIIIIINSSYYLFFICLSILS